MCPIENKLSRIGSTDTMDKKTTAAAVFFKTEKGTVELLTSTHSLTVERKEEISLALHRLELTHLDPLLRTHLVAMAD